ncbi:hypothetical protein HanPSC8_Chr04g0156241 [Helianthus annuus]|nr:hypothetical protein HanPSC8_Chr04g0156241 [Helianthus annuus]
MLYDKTQDVHPFIKLKIPQRHCLKMLTHKVSYNHDMINRVHNDSTKARK